MTTKIVELIRTEELRGDGTKENPTRLVFQLWDRQGQLVAWFDPHHRSSWVNGDAEIWSN